MQETFIDIYCPDWSVGLRVDASMVSQAIERTFWGRFRPRILLVPRQVYRGKTRLEDTPAAPAIPGRAAIFIERVFQAAILRQYEKKMALPNPEWFGPQASRDARAMIDVFLHKSRYSTRVLGDLFPGATHHYIGFTSPDPGVCVANYHDFCHFRGKATTRNSQTLLDLWGGRPDLPALHLQAYGDDIGLKVRRWLSCGNMNVMFGYHARPSDYFQDLARGGIHLCTSEVEGFGHCLNESRAMSALVLCVDAPPMNELMSSEFAVLATPVGQTPQHQGMRFHVTQKVLSEAVERVLALSPTRRRQMGALAREAYEADDRAFVTRFCEAIQAELA